LLGIGGASDAPRSLDLLGEAPVIDQHLGIRVGEQEADLVGVRAIPTYKAAG